MKEPNSVSWIIFTDWTICAEHKHITHIENNCNTQPPTLPWLQSAAGPGSGWPRLLSLLPSAIDGPCWHNQFVWTHAALNSNWALEALVGENYSGMMDSVPGHEGQGEAVQTDEQTDKKSVWHIQIQVSFFNRTPHKITRDGTSWINGFWIFLTSNFTGCKVYFNKGGKIQFGSLPICWSDFCLNSHILYLVWTRVAALPFIIRSDRIDGYIKLLSLYWVE